MTREWTITFLRDNRLIFEFTTHAQPDRKRLEKEAKEQWGDCVKVDIKRSDRPDFDLLVGLPDDHLLEQLQHDPDPRRGYGVVVLRRQGSKVHPVLGLTIPAGQSRKLVEEYRRRQRYTCSVESDGRIIFTPTTS